MRIASCLASAAVLFAACSTPSSPADSGTAPETDSGLFETPDTGFMGTPDTGFVGMDSGFVDSGPTPSDAGPADAGSTDSGTQNPDASVLIDAGPTGVACGSVLACTNGCTTGNTVACSEACLAQGTRAAQSLFSAVQTCIGGACPGGSMGVCATETSSCIACQQGAAQGACASEVAACTADESADAGITDAGIPVDAGIIDAGSDAGMMVAIDAGCVAESDSALCSAIDATCGSLSIVDNCGDTRTPNCGTCGPLATCDAVEMFCSCPTGLSQSANDCVQGIGQSCASNAGCPSGQTCVGANMDAGSLGWCDIVGCANDSACGTNGNVANTCATVDGGSACQVGCDSALTIPCANSRFVCASGVCTIPDAGP